VIYLDEGTEETAETGTTTIEELAQVVGTTTEVGT